MLFPNQEILLSFLFPVKAKYVVMIYGGMEFLGALQGGGGVSNLAHLGGMLAGFLFIRTQFGARGVRRSGGGFDFARWWRDYKIRRNKKKFQVYMRKHDSGPGNWKN